MRIQSLSIFISLAAACSALYAEETRAIPPPTKPAFVLRDIGYFHRWSQNDQHEFTPEGQQDLNKWSDMITANAYPDVDDAERLAEKANAVLEITRVTRPGCSRPVRSLGRQIGRRNI